MEGIYRSITIIAACFIVWAIVHSLLASLTAKRRFRKLFGENVYYYYRFGYVLFAAVTIAPLVILILTLPDRIVYAVPSPWRWLMWAGEALGAAIIARSIQVAYPRQFVGIAQLANGIRGKRASSSSAAENEDDSPRLRTNGLYGLVRHPMYLGSLVVMWLKPTMTANLLTLFALMTIYFYVGSIHEEKLLVRELGLQYLEYRKKVPRILPIPGIFRATR